MNPLVWLPEDALAFRCPVESVGCLRDPATLLGPPEGLPEGLRPDQAAAQRMAPFALLHLARLATGDGRSAVDACKELLLRAYGPPAAGAAPGQAPNTAFPDWLTHRRLAYQEGNDVPN